MSVAVQVVNGREQGTEEEEAAAASQGPETMEDAPASPKEDVTSDGDEQAGAPKKKKFKPWKSIRNMFKRKKSSKGSEGDGDPPAVGSKTMSKSTGELAMGGNDEGELDKRISMSEDSVFSSDKPAPTREEVRNSFALDSSNLADEISAKLKERANSTDDGYAQSSEDAMTTGDITQDNSDVAPSDSSKTDSGIITTEEEKSFSAGVREKQHAAADMKRLNAENPGDIDLDLIQGTALLSSSAAKHRISVVPSNRKPSKKARTPQRRSSSRLDDGPTPIEEEPTSPTKSPTPFILDSELPFPGVATPTNVTATNGSHKPLRSRPSLGLGPMVLPPIPPSNGVKGKRGSKREDQALVATSPSSPVSPQNDTKPHSPTVPEDIFLTPVFLDDERANDVIQKNGENKLDESMIDIFGDMDDTTDDLKWSGKTEDKTAGVEKAGKEETSDVDFESTRTEEKDEFDRRREEGASLFGEIDEGSLGTMADAGGDGDGDGMGGGIVDLDLTVDLPDPTVLGANIFGVETILEEEEEEVAGGVEGVTEMSNDFEEDDSMEDVGLDESRLQEEADVDEGLGGDKAGVVCGDIELRDEVIAEENVQSEKEEEVKLKPLMEEEKNIAHVAVVSKMTDVITNVSKPFADVENHGNSSVDGITSEVDIDEFDDDVDGSNYPGTSGRQPTLEVQKTVEPVSVKDGDEKTDTSKEVQEADIPVVFIDTSPREQPEKSLADDTPTPPGSKEEQEQVEQEEEEEGVQPIMMIPEPKEVIIIMKDAGNKKEPEKVEEKEKEEMEKEEESTPEPRPVETDALLEGSTKEAEEEKEKANVEMEKEEADILTKEPTKEEIVEERRLSVAASKALFEAKIPVPDPIKTNNRVGVNGFSHRTNNIKPVGEEQMPAAETKAEADTKVTEKEKVEEEKEQKIAPVIEMDKEEDEEEKKEEEEKVVSLKDRISRYQSLASKTKGITSHVPTRTSPSKQRPASTSTIENKDRKLGPKVPSKPSSTSSSKPSSTATTTDTSKPSTNPSSSSSMSKTTTSSPSSSTTPPVSSAPSAPSPSRKPLTPKIDHCLVCQRAVYQNEMSKLEGHVFHRRCQKCSECQRTLTLWNVDITGDKLYCKQHGSVIKNKQLQERLVAH